VMDHLLERYGSKGKTKRVSAILKEQEAAALPFPSGSTGAPDVEALLERVRIAEERAEQGAERECGTMDRCRLS